MNFSLKCFCWSIRVLQVSLCTYLILMFDVSLQLFDLSPDPLVALHTLLHLLDTPVPLTSLQWSLLSKPMTTVLVEGYWAHHPKLGDFLYLKMFKIKMKPLFNCFLFQWSGATELIKSLWIAFMLWVDAETERNILVVFFDALMSDCETVTATHWNSYECIIFLFRCFSQRRSRAVR